MTRLTLKAVAVMVVGKVLAASSAAAAAAAARALLELAVRGGKQDPKELQPEVLAVLELGERGLL